MAPTRRDHRTLPVAVTLTTPAAGATLAPMTVSAPPVAAPAVPPVVAPAPAAVTQAVPVPVPGPVVAGSAPAREDLASRAVRSQRIDNAEGAWRRGDHAAAARGLEPWAAAGVARAQLLMGQVQESRAGPQRSDFEAYVWYGVAARAGEAAAAALRDKVAARLQPAEVQQADKLIERWRPRPEPTDGSNP
jgi:hypothetical protein